MNLIFMGTPDFAVPSLKLLAARYNILAVYSQPPRPNGRGMKTIESPIQSTAKKLNLKTMTPHTLKSDDVFEEYKKLKPDVVVVVAYGLILPEKYLKIPKFGCVNGHASNLPRWRGAAPIQRAIEAGDTTSGSCIMIMEKGMDTGPILLSKKINIENNDTSKSLHDKLSDLTAQLLEEALYKYTKGILLPQKQEIEGIKYAHKIKKIESEIDWNLTALEISNKVRAFYPFPGTFTNGPNGLIKIITTQSNNDVHDQPPGTILNIGKKIFVACGNNTTLEILEVQKPGKNIISALAYLNGIKLSVGDKFGI
ncbi:methionyl-tRNA formyltransferase [Candidatus Levibacter sp. Uisw_134_01]|uniref:methionyl-tRNA formyltransferase n=1 Tax=Candidatus Levibacter sp. Uisw_134_01 TaxID=3230999 RepID=UPI003D3CB528